MFTGLIEGTGTVVRSSGGVIVLESSLLEDTAPGDSISVDGVCLTVTGTEGPQAAFHYSRETASSSIVSTYTRGTVVNIERPLEASSRLHGHLVTGHSDCVSPVTRTAPSGSDLRVWIGLDTRYAGLIVDKGSVAVNGISLTVVSAEADAFSVMLIPETLGRTAAGKWRPGTKVNLEFDIIGKYVARFLALRDRESRLRS